MFIKHHAKWVRDKLQDLEIFVTGYSGDVKEISLIHLSLNNLDWLIEGPLVEDEKLSDVSEQLIYQYLWDVRDFSLSVARSYGL